MRKTVIVAAIAAVALAGLGFFLIRGGEDRGEGDTADVLRPGASPSVDEERPDVTLADTKNVNETDEADLVSEATAKTGERTAIEAKAPRVKDSIPVLILRADTGEVVPGAEVFALISLAEDDRKAYNNLDEVDAWMEKHAVRLFANDQGELRVPADSEGKTLVLGRADGLWGKSSFRKPEEEIGPFHLELVPDGNLDVLVEDETGAQVHGITVKLGRVNQSWVSNVAEKETDKQGRVRFRHVLTHRRWDMKDPERFEVSVETLLETNVDEVLDAEDLPTTPVRFVIPATGTVAVHVLDLDGEPWEGDANVRLAVVREGERKEASPFASRKRPSMGRETEEGVALFRFVGLDLDLAVAVTRNLGSVPSHGYGKGPTSANARVEFNIRLGSDHPVIQVRVVGETGAPLINEKIHVRVEATSQMMGGSNDQWPSTDSEGRLRIDLSPSWGADDTRVASLTLGPKETPTASATLELSRSFEEGLNDLGDIQLLAPSLFVAGQVLDEAGRPLKKARLALRRQKESAGWWENVWDFRKQTDELGRFEVYTTYEGDAFSIGASKAEMAGSPVQFKPGDANVLVQLTAAGDLLGSILLDDNIPADKLRIQASPTGGSDQDHFIDYGHGQTNLDEDGTFEITDLQPGPYDVSITLENSSDSLLKVELVQILGARETRDPRLQSINLRGKLHAFHFTVVTPDGGHEVSGNLKYGAAGAEALDHWHWFNSTEFDLVSQDEAIDVDVSSPGYRFEELRNLRDDVTIELSEGISVRIVLRGDAEIPKAPFYVKPALVPVDGDQQSINWGADSFDETREVVLRAVSPGRNKVRWVLERRSGQGAMATSVDTEPEQFIEVAPGLSDQVFEVTLSEEQMQEILASLSR